MSNDWQKIIFNGSRINSKNEIDIQKIDYNDSSYLQERMLVEDNDRQRGWGWSMLSNESTAIE